MKRYLLLFGVLLFAGCSLLDHSDDSRSSVTFTVDRESYTPGQTITATLENNSDKPVGYNLCMTELQQHRNGEWVSLGPHAMCPSIMILLQPGAKESYRIDLGNLIQISQGRYRLLTNVEVKGEDKNLTTPTFSISATVQQ